MKQFHAFLTWILKRGEWSLRRAAKKRKREWIGPRIGLDVVLKSRTTASDNYLTPGTQLTILHGDDASVNIYTAHKRNVTNAITLNLLKPGGYSS
jgi:hypothetical protein